MLKRESSRHGTGFMTMPTTMIWGFQIRVKNMPAQFSEGPSSLTLEEEELEDQQPLKVSQLNLVFVVIENYYPEIHFSVTTQNLVFVLIEIFVLFVYIDPKSESPLPLIESLFIYVPRDERFGHLKMSDLIAYALKSISQILKPDELDALLHTQKGFDSLEDVLKLYEGGVELPDGLLKFVRSTTPAETVKELFRTDGERVLKFPVPQVIKGV